MTEKSERLRTLKNEVERNAQVIEGIVEQIVRRYNRDLEELVIEVKAMLDKKGNLTDEELELITVKLPVFMYFAAGGVEVLGVESDSAKALKLAAYNQKYLTSEGTIQDKTKEAELKTLDESIIDVAFSRAYKQLKTQLEMAEHIFSGVKKVLSKRLQEAGLTNSI
jgi:uncharacterized membrane protein